MPATLGSLMSSESSVDPIHHLTMSMAENSGSAWQIAGVEAFTFEGKRAFSQSLSLGLGKIILTIKNKFFHPDSTSNLVGQMFQKCNFFPFACHGIAKRRHVFWGKNLILYLDKAFNWTANQLLNTLSINSLSSFRSIFLFVTLGIRTILEEWIYLLRYHLLNL